MEENISEYDVGEIKPSLSILATTTILSYHFEDWHSEAAFLDRTV